jgi:hypothetical protein
MSPLPRSPVWKCVCEDRLPRPLELNSLATRILREAFNDDDTPLSHYRAEMLAHAALEGDRNR